MIYRVTIYDNQGEKDVVCEDEDDDVIIGQVETCYQDLFKGAIRSFVVSRITGRTGIRNDL